MRIRLPAGNTAARPVVYRPSMIPVLAALLLAAGASEGHIGEEPAPIPAEAEPRPAAAAPESAAVPADPAPGRLPEATAPQQPPKPAVPKQQLKILAQDSRLEAYGQFRELYEAARFDEALPYAKRVVELSEANPERDHELPIAYNNLGATQYQLGDYPAAEASYRKSLELLEATQGISSRRMIVPLAGLGAVFAARDDHKAAAELFDQALAVSRRADGLFNLQQLPLIRQAADSRYAFSDFGGAEREHMYALKVAEQNFGYGDPRTLAPLLEFAEFYESLREFIAARMMYLRARDVAMKANTGYSPEAVRSLCGIARTHRLQYTMDPETLESQQPARDEVTGEMVGKVYRESRVPAPAADKSGLKALQTALEMLRSIPEPPQALMTETLIELGDWFQSTSRPVVSAPYYAEASGIYEAQAALDPMAGNPLNAPRLVFYRPPVSASRGLNTLSGQYMVRKAVFRFEVSDAGQPQSITVVSTNMNDDQLQLSRRSLQKAIYSPRFSAGKPVSTAGVTFTGEWYEEIDPKKPVEPPPAQPAQADAPATAAAATPPSSSP
jgi:tetratricopeptide (TPR) repeat protein